ncbi:MAG TPA: hypothetical protein VKX28_13690 [Xanthobacteraceae bacterium]|nr:hypothetical protein [Xanthobacteraceae bacterium]
MSDSGDRSRKILVTVLFLVIGLPPGLCSLSFIGETVTMLHASGPENAFYGRLFGVLCLVGFTIFAVMLGLLIWTWCRRE